MHRGTEAAVNRWIDWIDWIDWIGDSINYSITDLITDWNTDWLDSIELDSISALNRWDYFDLMGVNTCILGRINSYVTSWLHSWKAANANTSRREKFNSALVDIECLVRLTL